MKEEKELMFKSYIADGLYVLSHHSLKSRFIDLYNDAFRSDSYIEQNADEIKSRILKKLKGG